MDRPHRHNELELNLVERGFIVYLFPGRRIEVQAGELFFFWSAVPHQMIARGQNTHIHWMMLPLAEVLQWKLPKDLMRSVLEGKPVISADDTFIPGDLAGFRRWHADLLSADQERRQTLLLEVQARLRRLADIRPSSARFVAGAAGSQKGETMARYLSEHFLENWRIRDVAREVDLHPNYAAQVFQQTFGITMVEYATQLKIAMAQQKLVMSEQDILTIAFDCGFGSISRFYTAFKAVTDTTPHAFRAALRWVG